MPMALHESRLLASLWIASLLLVAAPCSRSANDASDGLASSLAEARDPEVDAVRALLAPLARQLGEGEREALASALVEASREHGLPPAFVLAVIEVESRFDPYAVSPVGALGLMQVLPSTGAPVARRLGIAWRGPQTLFDPDANVRIGVAYLRELIDRYANVRAALAAYNWGPSEIDARLRSGTMLPATYVERVLDAYSSGRRTDS
jgi:soluble lytic murein transglycosylase-like protein